MNYSELEKIIIQKWKEDRTFEKQKELNRQKQTVVFLDGPPFANGSPHYGHLINNTIKDIITRYWAMCGYNIPSRWGWDCIAEGSLINMADGTSIPIEKFDFLANVETLKIDENIYGYQNKLAIVNKGLKECIQLIFNNGYKLGCTDNHQIYTTKGWMEAKDITDEEIYAAPINPVFEFNQKYWENFVDQIHLGTTNFIMGRKSAAYCRIIGYMLSRGNIFDTEEDIQAFTGDINLVFRLKPEYHFSKYYYANLPHSLKYLENYRNFPKIFLYDSTPIFLKKEFLSALLGGSQTEGNVLWNDEKMKGEILEIMVNIGVLVSVDGNKIYLKDEDRNDYFSKLGFRYASKKRMPHQLVKLVSRESIGKKLVFDITVKETHNFIANGIVVHNCHGLTIEYEVDKILGISSKEEILKLGISKYNEACRSIVMNNTKKWITTIERIGRWIDMENDYKTCDREFMSKVWSIFSELWKKGLVYQDTKVIPYSTVCTTPLSNFEAELNYKKVQDKFTVIKFAKTNSYIPTYFLVGITKPWTLITNLALCVNPNLDYVVCDKNGSFYVLLESSMEKYGFSSYFSKMPGKDLIGLDYEPLFNYLSKEVFKIVGDKSVIDGTGIIPLAPSCGEEDHRICIENNIIGKNEGIPSFLDTNGKFTGVDFLEGINFKDADKMILKCLKEEIYHQSTEHREYPFCWRSDTPLLHQMMTSIFINVEKIKSQLAIANEKVNWIPQNNKMLKDIKDWCISRNRYWGTPIPLWKSDDGEMICLSCVEELEKLAHKEFPDIHRHFIEDVILEKDGKKYKRIDDVFDCWFESGCIPFIYTNGPANIIAEGIDQINGWFYTLLVLGVALKGEAPYKNAIVNGLVLANDGEKMSKSKKNYPDPNLLMEKYGADALRLYLISSGIVKGESHEFREEGIQEIIQNVHQYSYNILNFLKQYIPFYEQKYLERFRFYRVEEIRDRCNNILDQMILAYLQEFVDGIHKDMKEYQLENVVKNIEKFIGQLSRTYLNMNKTRLKTLVSKEESITSLNTLFYVFRIFSQMIAPFAPFMAENFYQELNVLEGACNIENDFNSVHLCILPSKVCKNSGMGLECINILEKLIESRGEIRAILQTAKKPVKKQIIYVKNWRLISFLEEIEEILKSEFNIMEYEFSSRITEVVKPVYEINMQEIGKRFKSNAKNVKQEIESYLSGKEVTEGNKIISIGGRNEEFKDEIKVVYEINTKKTEGYHVQNYSENGLVILSDMKWDNSLQNIYLSKLLTRDLMKLRKEMGLIPTDCCRVVYKNLGEERVIEDNLWELYQTINMAFDEWHHNVDLGRKHKTLLFEEGEIKYELILILL